MSRTNIPPIKCVQVGDGYAVHPVSWQELDTWAQRNHSVWHRVTAETRFNSVSDVDFLKVLASALLRENIALHERTNEDALRRVKNTIIIKEINNMGRDASHDAL